VHEASYVLYSYPVDEHRIYSWWICFSLIIKMLVICVRNIIGEERKGNPVTFLKSLFKQTFLFHIFCMRLL